MEERRIRGRAVRTGYEGPSKRRQMRTWARSGPGLVRTSSQRHRRLQTDGPRPKRRSDLERILQMREAGVTCVAVRLRERRTATSRQASGGGTDPERVPVGGESVITVRK